MEAAAALQDPRPYKLSNCVACISARPLQVAQQLHLPFPHLRNGWRQHPAAPTRPSQQLLAWAWVPLHIYIYISLSSPLSYLNPVGVLIPVIDDSGWLVIILKRFLLPLSPFIGAVHHRQSSISVRISMELPSSITSTTSQKSSKTNLNNTASSQLLGSKASWPWLLDTLLLLSLRCIGMLLMRKYRLLRTVTFSLLHRKFHIKIRIM